MNRLRKLRNLRIAITLSLSFALLTVGTPAFAASAQQVQEVRELLEQYHISKPDDGLLAADEIDKMVEALHDPYTQYFDDDDWNAFASSLDQKFVGVGIVMSQGKDAVLVESVVPGSPAEAAGVLPGDVIAGADGQSLKGKTVEQVQKQLRGEAGTTVQLQFTRGGKAITFSIERKEVHLPVVTAKLLSPGIGYLALSGFTSDSGSEVKRQLEQLETQGLTSLVLDLRNNGGGYVDAAQAIASLFIDKGVLAHMMDRDGTDRPIELLGTKKPYTVVVLVNGNSASASELLSGALQDYGVAKLVGTKTYGKGVVQSLIPVKSGGVLKVTVQEYLTPTGRKVDKTGLIPDVYAKGMAEQLVDAYRLAGGMGIELTLERGIATMNGLTMAEPNAAIWNKKTWYVDTRLAAALVGANVSYDSQAHAVKLTKGASQLSLKTNDVRMIVKDGRSNVDVGLIAKTFAGFAYSVSGETLKLSANLQ
ncbi:S41 family peptidase [Cohnella suwonensis]|uniref:S41 family peptidase n=1 Tax=Cohnella suwonensis TaxID=696072 RepID=A0ABW0LSU7_9BACL